jgi:hypothetical protein
MSVQDFIRTAAPPPDWLQKAWAGAKQRGLNKLTTADLATLRSLRIGATRTLRADHHERVYTEPSADRS